MRTGIVIVDHGSRRQQSNEMLEDVAAQFARRFTETYDIVEPAHMELAEPSIETAFARCIDRGATHVVVCPFFLGPGKHWTGDIPRLAAAACAEHRGATYHVTMPLGIDELILELLAKRAGYCVEHEFRCESCLGTMRSGESNIAPLPADAPHMSSPQSSTCSSCPYAAAGVPFPAATAVS